ncbi:MAG: phosphoribosylaminoimidazolesuccinocarboxamide synthase [Planctomycetia bacterium]
MDNTASDAPPPTVVVDTRPYSVGAVDGRPLACRRGKVRDVYDLGDRLVLVATDRISAFDWVFPNGVPDKGKILTALSLFWFRTLGVGDQLLATDLAEIGEPFVRRPDIFAGRSILVRKTTVVPIECVVRGYLAGTGLKEYRATGAVCGHQLPPGLREADRLPAPIFTPATKADVGHDENISHARAAEIVGPELAAELERRSLDLYDRAARYALERGIILADTKFEFGETADGRLILVDEALTPDSSRFWPAASYAPGASPPSFDKQYVRDWLESIGFDKQSEPPPLPPDVAWNTRAKYVEAYERLTGVKFVG